MSTELLYVALIFGLFVVPKIFERFLIPSAITAFLMGMLFHHYKLVESDAGINLLGMLGITSLFLFAGLEVEFENLKENAKMLIFQVLGNVVLLILSVLFANHFLDLNLRQAIIFSLAILTPSSGFIINFLNSNIIDNHQKDWIKTVAIGVELIALIILFFVLKSESVLSLSISLVQLILLIFALPVIFRIFARLILPFAQGTEAAFFLMLATIFGYLTKKLGIYYLFGSFIVGISINRFKGMFPAMQIDELLKSLRLFSSFFIPFYFFSSGQKVDPNLFSFSALSLALGLFVIIMISKAIFGFLMRYMIVKNGVKDALMVSLGGMPTLIFGLVLANILKSEFNLADNIYAALLLNTILLSIVPTFIMKKFLFEKLQ